MIRAKDANTMSCIVCTSYMTKGTERHNIQYVLSEQYLLITLSRRAMIYRLYRKRHHFLASVNFYNDL